MQPCWEQSSLLTRSLQRRKRRSVLSPAAPATADSGEQQGSQRAGSPPGNAQGLLWRESFALGFAPCEVPLYLAPFAGYSKASRSFRCSCQLGGRADPTPHPGRGHGAAGPNIFPSHRHSSFGKEPSARQSIAYSHLFSPNISLNT